MPLEFRIFITIFVVDFALDLRLVLDCLHIYKT